MSDNMGYVLLALSAIMTVVATSLSKVFTLKNYRGVGAFSCNIVSCLAWLAILMPCIVTNEFAFFSVNALVYGIIYGTLLFLLLWCTFRANEEGPFSVTRLVSCPAFIVPTLFSALFLGEDFAVNQIVATVMILASLGMCANPGFSIEPLTKKWFFYAFCLFVVNGIIGIFYKVAGKYLLPGEYDFMFTVSALTAIVMYLGVIFFQKSKKNIRPLFPRGIMFWIIFVSGLFTCIYIRLNLQVSAILPGTVIFPLSNCAIVILSTLVSLVVFKEKISKVQIAGILEGLVAILIFV